MNLDKAIRTGVYLAIEGNISFNGENVESFDAMAVAENQNKYPYILLSSQTHEQRNGKVRRPYDATLQVDIVTGAINPIGRDMAEDIEEQISSIVCPDDRIDLDIVLNGWEIKDTRILSSRDFNSRNGQYYVFRKVVVYSFIVSKI